MPSTTFYNLPAEKRERLLSAARAEFARVPYEDASVNRIIRAAGIPRGSFYMYFTDKEELFRFLMETYGGMLADWMGSSWTPTAGICSPRFWPCMTSFRTTGSGGPSRSWGPSCAATGR